MAENNWSDFMANSQEVEYTLIHDAFVEHVASQSYSIADINYILSVRKAGVDMFEKIALFHLALYVEDYDTGTEVSPEDYKNSALSAASDDDERVRVQDEHEAYVNFRMGLAKT